MVESLLKIGLNLNQTTIASQVELVKIDDMNLRMKTYYLPLRRKSSHVTVIRLGSSQEGQAEISSTEKPVSNERSAEKLPEQKCVTVVTTNQDQPPVFKIPPPPMTTPAASTTATSVSGIPLLPPPPGSSKTRTAGHNMQVNFC